MVFRDRVVRVLVVAGICTAPIFVTAGAAADETSIAITLATGADIARLQRRVDGLERKAIANAAFSADDKAFLRDLYGAMASGASHSVVFAQSGRLMDRYLDGSGKPLELDAAIFRDNARVRQKLDVLVALSAKDGATHRSSRFYMPDPSKLDSVTGLYWGTVETSIRVGKDGTKVAHCRAEVPWEWPSYESLQRKYGTPHAETFVLPNLGSLAGGAPLRIENGLGEYLVRLGLAKPFLAWAEWDEPLKPR
ncbi:MAG TPA: hypothetical protein VIF62_09165 [Labilithrix sp.]